MIPTSSTEAGGRLDGGQAVDKAADGDRRITDRRIIDRRITDRRITDRRIIGPQHILRDEFIARIRGELAKRNKAKKGS